MNKDLSSRDRNHVVWGVLLITVGGMVLLDNLGWLSIADYWHFWPLVLVVFGLNKMLDFSSSKQFSEGLMLAATGCWLYMVYENIWGLTFQNSWPIIVIAYGVSILLKPVIGAGTSSNKEHRDGK